jgi:hypothetical protein
MLKDGLAAIDHRARNHALIVCLVALNDHLPLSLVLSFAHIAQLLLVFLLLLTAPQDSERACASLLNSILCSDLLLLK